MPIRDQSVFTNVLRSLLVLCVIQAFAITQARGADSVKIGNFVQSSPCGIAWIVDDSASFALDTGGAYVAGTAAPDDSYHLYRFAKGSAHVSFEWGRVGDDVVGRISADRPVRLDLKLSSGWPKWKATFRPDRDGVSGVANSSSGTVHWTLQTSPAPKSISGSKVSVLVTPQVPLRFVAGLSLPPSFESIDTILESACDRYEATRPRAAGEVGDFVGAIADNMNNSRLYATNNRLLSHSVSRTWGKTAEDFPYFGWDSFFNANLAALEDLPIAQNTVRAIFSYCNSEGMVPNAGHWVDAGIITDRSEPPVAALCIWKMHQRYPSDVAFLNEVYPKLVKYHNWWPKFRDAKKDGLLEWGTDTGDFQNAQYETGWDDNLHFAAAMMHGKTMNCYAVDLCSMWSMDAHYLALIADALGKPDDATHFRQDEADMNRRINEKLWNDKLGIYCSRFWDDAEILETVADSAFTGGFDGEYFSDETLKTSVAKRHDAKLDVDWKDQPPIAPLKTGKNWSARWKTTFTPPSPGHYRLRVSADDGVRVIVDGKTVIDDWSVHVNREKTWDITFKDVHPLSIVIEYYQHEGGAELHFSATWIKPANGEFLTRISPMNFYPLSAGAADPERAKRALAVLTDPKKFWGKYLLPTISYDDPGYHFQEYWRGDVWGPANYLAWLGIRRYATPDQATEFADRSRDLFMNNWLKEGVCSENFNSITGKHSSDPHYTWGALLNLIALENIIDVDDNGRIILNGDQKKKITLYNIPLLGQRYDVKTEPGSAVLIRDGKVVLTAKGTTVCAQTLP